MAGEIRIGERVSGRMAVSLPYNPLCIAKIKSIEGYGWHPEGKYWSFPLNEGVVEKLLSIFEGEGIDIDPSLRVGLRYIQELLGHYSSKTTEIYTHVSNKDLSRIRSPLDSIMGGDKQRDGEFSSKWKDMWIEFGYTAKIEGYTNLVRI